MTKIINWGFIGLGNASLNLAKEFKKIRNARLLSVASHTKEKRDFFKQKYHLKDQNIFSKKHFFEIGQGFKIQFFMKHLHCLRSYAQMGITMRIF